MPFRRFIIFQGLFLVLTLTAQTAGAQLLDTVKYSLHQKPKFFAILASYNTFIDHQFANVFRVKAGLNYNQKIRFGIGYANLSDNSVITNIHINENDLDYYTNGELNLTVFSLSAEYFFFYDYPWQCTVTPLDIGYGFGNYEYVKRPEHLRSKTSSESIIFYQPEVSVQYNIFTWFGIGATTGYRISLYRSDNIIQELNAPTFAIDFRLFLDEIYKGIFEPEKNNQ